MFKKAMEMLKDLDRWAAVRRERERIRRVAQEMLRHSDTVLEDAGFTRAALRMAASHPEKFNSFEDVRALSAPSPKRAATIERFSRLPRPATPARPVAEPQRLAR